MAYDIETLLSPVSAEAPMGPDLQDEPARVAIQTTMDAAASEDQAERAIAADWPSVGEQVVEMLGRTKDVTLAVWMCQAGAYAGALDLVEAGAETLAALLERHWESVHPDLGTFGVLARTTRCSALAHGHAFLNPLEATTLVAHRRLGRFSAVDLKRFVKEGEGATGLREFQDALKDLGDAGLREARARIAAIEAALRRAEAAFGEHDARADAPDFRRTYARLAGIASAIDSFAAPPANPSATEPETDEQTRPQPRAPAPAVSAGGAIETREDVTKAIDAICDYYRRREPSSPVPLVLQRARLWVTQDFLTVLQDIAPDSASAARLVLEPRKDE